MQKETYIEKRLKRIRSNEESDKFAKKRKRSKIIMLVNIVVLSCIIIYFQNTKNELVYHSTTINYQDLNFRFSISSDKNTNNYLFSLAVTSKSNREKTFHFNKSVAILSICYNTETIYKRNIGKNIVNITLKPGQSKILIEEINYNLLKHFPMEHPEYIQPKKKSFLQLLHIEKSYIPLTALITINMNEELSTSLNLRYEVQ